VSSAARVLHRIAVRFPGLGRMSEIVDACIDRMGRNGNNSELDLALLELMTILARICLAKEKSKPLAHMRRLIGCLKPHCEQVGPCKIAACNLLELLLIKDSGATPVSWPHDAATYSEVSSLFACCEKESLINLLQKNQHRCLPSFKTDLTGCILV